MHTNVFLSDLATVMLAAGATTVLFRWLRQPVVLGYILAGLLIGPHLLPRPLIADQESISTLAELGIVFLLFFLGLEFNFRKIRQIGVTAFIVAPLETGLMFFAGFEIGRLFGWATMDCVYLGAVMMISSTTIIAKTLADLGRTREKSAEVIFGILIAEDIIAILTIASLSTLAAEGGLQWDSVLGLLGRLAIFLVAAIVAGLLLVPRLLRFVAGFRRDETLLVAVLGLCFGFALLAAELHFSVGLGAFIIGAVIAESDAIRKIERLAAPLRDMFSAVFFVAIGLLIDPKLVRDYAVPIAVITIVIVLGKILACSFGCAVAGFERQIALRAGLGLAQIGEFSFIIAALGVSVGATSKFLYPIAVTVSALTTVLTPYLIRHADKVARLLDRFAPRSLLDYLDDYAQWARTFWQGRRASMPRRLLGKVLAQLAVNFALIAACFLAAVFVHSRGWVALERWPSWLGSAKTALWLGALVLSLPVVIATLRKLQAFGMMIGELTVSHPSQQQRVVLRALVANTVLFTGCVMLALMVLLLSSVLLPPGEILIVLTGIAVLLALSLKTTFVRIYARAQGVIREILSREESAHAVEHRDELPSLLEEAQLLTLRVTDKMPATGRTIGDLRLRTHSGASVVVVKRGAETITNPDPDVDFRAGDEVLLLGTPPQLREARKTIESGAG